MAKHFVVIGGGIIGLATAYKLLLAQPDARVTLLEKEAGPARHQSGRNSGVIHAGLYYQPGSLKARLCTTGRQELAEFCLSHNVPHEICGKLVVASTSDEVGPLKDLKARGEANGLRDLRLLGIEEMREIEPNVAGVAALHVKEEGIVDYQMMCVELIQEITQRGGTVHFDSEAKKIERVADGWNIVTSSREIAADYLINCAGLYSDLVAKMAGERPSVQIIPFRGEYFKLRPSAESLVRNLIYPVPHPKFPFLGIHFTRSIKGGIDAGPNAVLAFAREGYRKYDVVGSELLETLTFPGLWKFLIKHRGMCWAEFRRSGSSKLFCEALQALVPAIRSEDLVAGGAGIRAQAMAADGSLVQDFVLIQRESALHVVNAPSPGATASLAIAGDLVRMITSP
jgi:L-2-hydroxyglutarate oxidase